MATLLDIRGDIQAAVRDTTAATWSTDEIDLYVNQGIDALADFYPREIVQTVGTVSAGVSSYAASSFTRAYRLDVYSSAGSYRFEIPHLIGEANSGWEIHGSVIYLPPSYTWTAGDTLRLWGYGRYTQLAASSSTTDLDQSGIYAVMEFAKYRLLDGLIYDRARFQQWQADSQNTDTSLATLGQQALMAQRKWEAEKTRLRRMRKS